MHENNGKTDDHILSIAGKLTDLGFKIFYMKTYFHTHKTRIYKIRILNNINQI